MKLKKYIEKLNNPLILALLFTIPTMIVFLITEPQLSGAGDLNIADFIMSGDKIKDGFYYISPLLSKFLKIFCALIPINWWSICSVFILCVGLFTCLWFAALRMKQFDFFTKAYILILFSILFWELILKQEVSFNFTATVAFLAGLVCLIYYATEKKQWPIFAAILLFWIAGEIRKKAFFMAAPFGVMVLLYYYIFPLYSDNLIDSLKESWKSRKRSLISAGIIVAMLIVVLGAYRLYNLDPEIKYRDELNTAAHKIDDYQSRYPKYDENEELYKNAGIPKSWFGMVNEFVFSDEKVFTPQTLSLVLPLRLESQVKFSDLFTFLKDQKFLVVVMLIFISYVFVLVGKRRGMIPLVGSALGTVGCTLFCSFLGRITSRLVFSYLLCSLVAFFFMSFSDSEIKQKGIGDGEIKGNSLHGILEGIAVIFLVVVIMFAVVRDEKDGVSVPRALAINQNQADTLAYINNDKENVYLHNGLIRYTGAYNLWAGHEPDYLDNYYPLTSCFVLGSKESLARYGIYDVYKSIISMPNIRVENQTFSTETLFNYFRDFYNPKTSMSVVENIKGNLYLRYAEPVLPTEISETEMQFTIRENNEYDTISGAGKLYDIEAILPDDVAGNYDDILISVCYENGDVYSYGLRYKDAKANGTIIFKENDIVPDNAEWIIIGRDNNKNYHILSDVSDKVNMTKDGL